MLCTLFKFVLYIILCLKMLTSWTRYCTISILSNIAAQCNGVIFWTSQEESERAFSFGCSPNMSLTMSIAPWAQARCTGVDKSCCWVDILAPDRRQSSTAYHHNNITSVTSIAFIIIYCNYWVIAWMITRNTVFTIVTIYVYYTLICIYVYFHYARLLPFNCII